MRRPKWNGEEGHIAVVYRFVLDQTDSGNGTILVTNQLLEQYGITKKLENMVKEVNATQVEPADQLTDHAYHYDSQNHIFELADKYEERQREADYDKKNWFDIEKYLNRKLVLHPNDEYEVFNDA